MIVVICLLSIYCSAVGSRSEILFRRRVFYLKTELAVCCRLSECACWWCDCKCYGNTRNRFFMMMQSGLELNYTASHAERYMGPFVQDVDGVDRFFSVSIPLNLGLCLGGVGGSIDPYAGVEMRVNMVGKSRVDGFECVDYFDDLNAKRFQLGLNAGVDVNFVIFYLGYRFTKDMTDFIPGMYSRNSCHKFVLGFNILY